MKKKAVKFENMVQSDKTPKNEKLYFVQYGQVRRHSRVLYLPLDATMVRLNSIKKGDIIKYQLLELRRAPPEEED